jgi:glycosyltransferase involved in cell wall biosynthesis
MTPGHRPRVVQLFRQPYHHQVSIERVFAAVRPYLPQDLDVVAVVSRHPNRGLVPRLRSVLEARRRRGDVTHVTGDITYTALLLPRRSTVLTVHDTEFLLRASTAKRLLYSWLWLRLPVARSAVVTVPSDATRRDLLAVVGARAGDRVLVVRNPVGEEFVPGPGATGAGLPLVLLMGTWPNKNLAGSVAALTGMRVRVVVVGPLDAAQRAQLAASGLDVQSRTDLSDDEVVALYREAALLLFPSTKEGFGLPVLEAQAVGCPVVTSDRLPLSEVAGGGACLVDPQDVASIRAGVQRVLADRDYRDRLVEVGRRNVERYRPAAVAADYAEVYRTVLSGRPGAGRPS